MKIAGILVLNNNNLKIIYSKDFFGCRKLCMASRDENGWKSISQKSYWSFQRVLSKSKLSTIDG